MKKKTITLTIAGMMAVSLLAGCAKSAGTEKTPDTSQASTETSAVSEADEEAGSDWYMKVLTDEAMMNQYPYCRMIDVNGDDVPELFLSSTADAFITDEDQACVVLDVDGEAKTVKEIGHAGGESFYYNPDEKVLTYYSRLSGEAHLEVCEIKDGDLEVVKTLDNYGPHHDPDVDNAEEVYRIDGSDVSKEDYEAMWETYAKDEYAVTYEAAR